MEKQVCPECGEPITNDDTVVVCQLCKETIHTACATQVFTFEGKWVPQCDSHNSEDENFFLAEELPCDEPW